MIADGGRQIVLALRNRKIGRIGDLQVLRQPGVTAAGAAGLALIRAQALASGFLAARLGRIAGLALWPAPAPSILRNLLLRRLRGGGAGAVVAVGGATAGSVRPPLELTPLRVVGLGAGLAVRTHVGASIRRDQAGSH